MFCYQGKTKQHINEKRQPLPTRSSHYQLTKSKIQEGPQLNKIINNYKQYKQTFKTNLEADALKNTLLLKEFIIKIDQVQNLESIFDIKIENSISFQSLSKYFRNQERTKKSEYSKVDQLIQNMIEVYLFFIDSKKHEKQLIICIEGYLQAIRQTMNSGHKDANNYKFPGISQHLKKIQHGVYTIMEDFLKICTQKFTMQRSKIYLQSIAGSPQNQSLALDQELKLRETIKNLELNIQKLRKQNESLSSQNNILLKKTIPQLKQNFTRKQSKEIDLLSQIKVKFQEIQNKIVREQKSLEIYKFKKPMSSIVTIESQHRKSLPTTNSKFFDYSKEQNIFSSHSPVPQSGVKEKLIKDILEIQKNIDKSILKYGYFRSSVQENSIEEQRLYEELLELHEKIKSQNFQLINSFQQLKEEKYILARQSQRKENEYKRQIRNLCEKIQITSKKWEISNQRLQISSQKLRISQGNLTIIQNQYQQICFQNQQLKKQVDRLKQAQKKYVTQSFLQQKLFFNQSILRNHKIQKQYLKERIQTLVSRQIDETKILYSYKKDSKINFHEKIDNHQNILLIVQTNNAIFAGFYSGILQDQTAMTQQALIISLNHRKQYLLNNLKNYPKKDPKDQRIIKAMVYDKYYIIFGNAQIRIKHGQNKVFSNFGIANSYFNHQNDKATYLLCEEKQKEVEFVDYEIYEVIFNSNQIL